MKYHWLLAITLGMPTAASATTLLGSQVLATNTFQGASTNNVEVDVGDFGFENNLSAVVAPNGVEFPSFIDIYDVDIGANSVAFTWVDTEFSRGLNGPTPAGNFDRNYFTFDLPAGVAIVDVNFDAGASQLLPGSALPSVELLATDRFVTVFAEGVERGIGFNPSFTVTTAVPLPATVTLLMPLLAMLSRRRRERLQHRAQLLPRAAPCGFAESPTSKAPAAYVSSPHA